MLAVAARGRGVYIFVVSSITAVVTFWFRLDGGQTEQLAAGMLHNSGAKRWATLAGLEQNVDIFKNVGTIRNKMVGHGGGPDPIKPAPEHAENMIHLVSSHIVLLARLAKM
jgi:hypothetical protein